MKKNITEIIGGIMMVLLILSNIYLIFSILLLNNIENTFRLIIIIMLLILLTIIVIIGFKIRHKGNKLKKIYIFIMLVYSIVICFISLNIRKVYNNLKGITTNYLTHSMSIVTLLDHDDNYYDGIIGIIDNSSISLEFVNSKELSNISKFNNYVDLINQLYDKKIDFAIVPTNYSIVFENVIDKDLKGDIKIIESFEEKIVVNNNNSKIDKPFSVLLMGVDSELDNLAKSSVNGDALILMTFNPNTLSATILSIPRDTYVPISCFVGKRKNKITHAAWYGEDCMINTIEDFLGIDIDYYAKINFRGLVTLVDYLGGIDVDVPISFCEQDSHRSPDNLICVNEGRQTLNGEQALALSRHRKTINDIKRGENQQLVIRGLINKLKDINSLNLIYSLLDTISNSMETNMNINEILSLYNIGKKILLKNKKENLDEIIDIKRLSINGYDAYIYDYDMVNETGTKMTLYEYVPYMDSVKNVIDMMKSNLELIDSNSSNIDNSNVYILPNFVGDKVDNVISYGNERGIDVKVNYITTNDSSLRIGEVISQSIPSGIDIAYIGNNPLNVTVVDKIEVKENINCSKEENQYNDTCILPDFKGKDYTEFKKWMQKNNYSYKVKTNIIELGDPLYDYTKKGKIISQNIVNESIYNIIGKTIELTYISDENFE